MPDPVLRFEYPGPLEDDMRCHPGRKHFYLFKTDRAVSEVQLFDKGINNKLHSHASEDGVWIVLEGSAVFHGEGDKFLGELGHHRPNRQHSVGVIRHSRRLRAVEDTVTLVTTVSEPPTVPAVDTWAMVALAIVFGVFVNIARTRRQSSVVR